MSNQVLSLREFLEEHKCRGSSSSNSYTYKNSR